MVLPDFSSVATVVSLIVGSCLIAYLSSQRTLGLAKEDSRRQLELRLDGITGAIAELEARMAELTRRNASSAARPSLSAVRASSEGARSNGWSPPVQTKPHEEIPIETLIVITAAVTSFLGKKVRIRSARMLQSPYEIVNPWAQQGRVIVQASHTLRSWNRPDDPVRRAGPGVRR